MTPDERGRMIAAASRLSAGVQNLTCSWQELTAQDMRVLAAMALRVHPDPDDLMRLEGVQLVDPADPFAPTVPMPATDEPEIGPAARTDNDFVVEWSEIDRAEAAIAVYDQRWNLGLNPEDCDSIAATAVAAAKSTWTRERIYAMTEDEIDGYEAHVGRTRTQRITPKD